MALIRICPACSFANPASEIMCRQCSALIAEVAPTDEIAPDPNPLPEPAVEAGTIREAREATFYDEDGRLAFKCGPAGIIGRDNIGKEFFADRRTVSRKHCRINITPQGWVIEDLGSTNGTWINGNKITSPTPIVKDDRVQLSQNCTLIVKI